ncbi:MAG: outer membrane beta-barrel protein [Flavobacteriales bacterium]
MKKVASFCFLSLILSLGAYSTFAQDSAPRRLQAGMTGNFGINMVKPTDTYFNASPFNHDLSVGIIFNTSFKGSPNLGISTGFEFEFTKLNYEAIDSVFYRYAGSNILHQDELGGTGYLLTNRQYSTVGIAVPLMMLFRMDPIGDWKIFAKFGIRNSFMVSQRISDRGFDVGADANGLTFTAKENANLKSFGDQFFYKGSVGFSAGAEWNFAGSTSLVPELGFYYGLTPLHFRAIEDNYTFSDASGTYFYQKARQNQLILKLSLLF